MADDDKTPKDDSKTPPEPPEQRKADDVDPDEAALGDAGKRALARLRAERDELRTRAETLAEKAKKYDEQEEASKTEAQRKAEAAAAAEERAAKAELALARVEAALEAGLPKSAASRLVGTTPKELAADAAAYKAELDAAAGGSRRRVTADNGRGGDGPSAGMNALIRRSAGRPA